MSPGIELLPWLAPALTRGLALRAHALLLHGPGQVGQLELGLGLARGWLCETANAAHREPACGKCHSCRLMDSRSHPDFLLLIPQALRESLGWGAADEGDDGAGGKAGKAKPSREIRIDAVRSAIDWGHKTATRGRAKVILIHPAPALNAVAANALLKMLEEPAGRLRLVLTAHDPEALLPTVRSRCQRLQIELPGTEVSVPWLAEQGVAGAAVLLAAAGGQPLEALALRADGIDADAWQALPGAVLRGHPATVASWPLARLVDGLQKLCHDLMLLRTAAAAQPRYFEAVRLQPLLESALPSAAALAQWSAELLQAARHDEHPWHAGLRSEALVAQGARLWQTPRSSAAGARPTLDTLGVR